jgi:hypothetical protein
MTTKADFSLISAIASEVGAFRTNLMDRATAGDRSGASQRIGAIERQRSVGDHVLRLTAEILPASINRISR